MRSQPAFPDNKSVVSSHKNIAEDCAKGARPFETALGGPDVSMGDIFRGCGWFVAVDLVNVAILIAFPAIILFLPQTMIT